MNRRLRVLWMLQTEAPIFKKGSMVTENKETAPEQTSPEPTEEQIKEMLERVKKEYLDKLKERMEDFKKTAREGVKASLLYDQFKIFAGEFDSLFSSASPHLLASVAHKHINSLIMGVFDNYKRDNVEARYYIEKFFEIMEQFMYYKDAGAQKTLPGSLRIEQIVPVFFCHECQEKKRQHEDMFPDFNDRFLKKR